MYNMMTIANTAVIHRKVDKRVNPKSSYCKENFFSFILFFFFKKNISASNLYNDIS